MIAVSFALSITAQGPIPRALRLAAAALALPLLTGGIARAQYTFTKIADFNGVNGSNPLASMILDAAGNLYGTTEGNGSDNRGTVFEIAAGTNVITIKTTFTFANQATNGIGPVAGVTLGADGNLYGAASYGGPNSGGTIFRIAAGANTPQVLANFNGKNGSGPGTPLLQGSDGLFYGTTSSSSKDPSGGGTVYSFDIGTGVIKTIAFLPGSNDPTSTNLLRDAAGNLYGAPLMAGPRAMATYTRSRQGRARLPLWQTSTTPTGAVPPGT